MTRIAVVGAGMSGLVVARRLAAFGDVSVFEKSRGPGGRMSTRYADAFEFDHGAQYFTAGSDAFRTFLQPLLDAGDVATWQPTIAEFDGHQMTGLRPGNENEPRFVGAPRMNRIGKAYAEGLDVRLGVEIAGVQRDGDGWTLAHADASRSGPYDWLILAAPAPQTAALANAYPELVRFCESRVMRGCFALMLGFEQPLDLAWQAAEIRNSPIGWIAVNSSKPNRGSPYTLVVHSANDWADAHIEDDREQAIEVMLEECSSIVGSSVRDAVHRQLHRWRYANADRNPEGAYFLDRTNRLAACGDWCIRGRVEEAFTSGNELANALSTLLR